MLPDPALRHAALALDTGSQGLLYIVGPPLVAALTAVHSAALALAVTAALGLAGAFVVALAPPTRRWRPAPSAAAAAGPVRRLANPGLLLLFVSLTGIGFAIGAMNVWSIAMAERHEQDMLAGTIPAACSARSFLSGLVNGRRTWHSTTTGRLTAAAGWFLAGWLPLLALPGPYAATAAVVLPGAFLTVVIACSFVTTDAHTPAGRTSEAYAWLHLSIRRGVQLARGASAPPRRAPTWSRVHPASIWSGIALPMCSLAPMRYGAPYPGKARPPSGQG